jgi:MFS family permease
MAVYVLCVGMLMIVLDATIVNVAWPTIQDDLGFFQNDLAWVVNAYLIAFGGLLLRAGRIGDLIGQQRIFLIGLAVFTAASSRPGRGAIGLAVLATFATERTDGLLADGEPAASALNAGYQLAYVIGAGLVLVAIAIAVTVLHVREREAAAEPVTDVAVEAVEAPPIRARPLPGLRLCPGRLRGDRHAARDRLRWVHRYDDVDLAGLLRLHPR